MSLALLSFAWMYWQTHRMNERAKQQQGSPVPSMVLIELDGGTP
ncbi:MAG: hypothetical protein U0228_29440 [Myxococcaceae bacterium]